MRPQPANTKLTCESTSKPRGINAAPQCDQPQHELPNDLARTDKEARLGLIGSKPCPRLELRFPHDKMARVGGRQQRQAAKFLRRISAPAPQNLTCVDSGRRYPTWTTRWAAAGRHEVSLLSPELLHPDGIEGAHVNAGWISESSKNL
jgi:hypothetical protein